MIRISRRHWSIKLLIGLLLIALGMFALWRWAVASGSAGLLDWIDARFERDNAVKLALSGKYGDHSAQKVELWRPAKPRAAHGAVPLIVFYHGGGWHSGAPEDYRFIARAMGDLGYATALVGYRLVPEGKYPSMLEDSAAGLRWVVDNGPEQGIGTEEIVLIGHSAGAYNVLMLGLDPQWLAGESLPSDTIDAVISLAGPADFYPFDKESSRNAFGHAENPSATQPVTFARPDAAPVLLLHGSADDVVRPRNSKAMHQALTRLGGRSELVEFPDMSHAGIIMAFARPFDRDRQVIEAVNAFISGTTMAAPSAPVQGAK